MFVYYISTRQRLISFKNIAICGFYNSADAPLHRLTVNATLRACSCAHPSSPADLPAFQCAYEYAVKMTAVAEEPSTSPSP